MPWGGGVGQSGSTLASQLWGRGPIPGTASSGKAGSCLPLVSSLQYTNLDTPTVCTGFLRPSNYPVVIYDLYSVEGDVKPQINK